MKAILLAAGRGSRMGAATDTQPKCFTQIAGRRLFDLQLEALREAGIHEIGVVIGYRAELMREGYGAQLAWFDNPEWASSSIVRSLLAAQDWLRESDCVISYSDIFYSAETVMALTASRPIADFAIAYDPQWLALWSRRFEDPYGDAESFVLNDSCRLLQIGDKRPLPEQVQGQYMGLLRTAPSAWARVQRCLAELGPARVRSLDMTALLRELLVRGELVIGVPRVGPWGEVDHPSDAALYERQLIGNDERSA